MELQFTAKKSIISPKSIYEILTEVLSAEDQLDQEKEHLWAIGLTAKNQIKYIDLVHLGGINQCPCHPMEIYRRACIKGIVSLIVGHNHPSGNPEPSVEDRQMTMRLKQAGEVLGIKFLDHIIIAKDSYFSFADKGEM